MRMPEDPVADIIRQHEEIVAAMQENLRRALTINMRKEDRIRQLEELAGLYTDPSAFGEEIAVLRRRLGI